MFHNTSPHHIEINVYKTLQQMISILNSSGVITIFPESPFPGLALIKFLPGSPCNQFNGIWYNITPLIIDNEKMDVV
jgi:hypothetical protein